MDFPFIYYQVKMFKKQSPPRYKLSFKFKPESNIKHIN